MAWVTVREVVEPFARGLVAACANGADRQDRSAQASKILQAGEWPSRRAIRSDVEREALGVIKREPFVDFAEERLRVDADTAREVLSRSRSPADARAETVRREEKGS